MTPQDEFGPNSQNMKELVALINTLFAKQPTLTALASNVALLASARAGEVTLNASGLATITFSSPYPVKPVMQYSYEEASDNPPVTVKTISFVKTGANWTGVNIKGYRGRALPTLTPLTIGALLTAVVTGVNSIVTALTGFNVFGGSSSGVVVQYTSRIPA